MPAPLLFLAAALAGFFGALDGVGGGLILTPILTAFGVDIREAIAINAVSVVAISNTASPSFLKHHLPNLKAVAFLECFAIMGALCGALLIGVLTNVFLFLLCGAILLISGILMLTKWQESPVQERSPEALLKESMLVGSYYDTADGKTVVYEGRNRWPAAACMFGVGLVAGLLGGGGGVLMAIVAHLVMNFPTKVSLTMSNLMMGVVALASLSIYLETGLINTQLVIPSILGVLVGAFLGAKTLQALKGRSVRGVFLFVLLILAWQMLSHGVRALR